jgi:hypothetical protein
MSAFVMLAMGIAGFSILGTIFGVRTYSFESVFPTIGAVAIFIALGIWALIDFIITVAGKMRDNEGRIVKKW